LDWDKPLSEQSEAVKTALRQSQSSPDESVWTNWTGQELYESEVRAATDLDGVPKGQARALHSDQLRKAGIPGIRYADGMSRGKDGGTYNYVMFDDKPISIEERGMASPEMLAITAAASGFLASRQEKKPQWDAMRADLLNAMNTAASFGLDAIEIPWKGILGATRVAGGLTSGESFNNAMFAGANQVRQRVDQTADDLGGAVVDYTGSPALGTAVNVGVNMGGPI
jgi:hypothetical protein